MLVVGWTNLNAGCCSGPLTLEESDDLLAPLEELVPIAPLGVGRVRQRYLLRVAGVLGVPGRLNLLLSGLLIEGW